ncbi:hypothetical protein WICPIJ_005528 [Wickerhamomyces pijperi]|uniref:Zn(2)-C6 fungal-type domain-containing protein n=1 Tax=Wickerhamomyces pijperi TaxID=599730 RepID=A0A9P8TLW2_WICPI|nr:hypothetical protein WICPIJ_005528 [Wickerhamomyces pijperi]
MSYQSNTNSSNPPGGQPQYNNQPNASTQLPALNYGISNGPHNQAAAPLPPPPIQTWYSGQNCVTSPPLPPPPPQYHYQQAAPVLPPPHQHGYYPPSQPYPIYNEQQQQQHPYYPHHYGQQPPVPGYHPSYPPGAYGQPQYLPQPYQQQPQQHTDYSHHPQYQQSASTPPPPPPPNPYLDSSNRAPVVGQQITLKFPSPSPASTHDPKNIPIPLYAIATTNSSKRAKLSPDASQVAPTQNAISPPTRVQEQARTQAPNQPQQMVLKDLNPEQGSARKKTFRTSRRRHRNSHLGCATCKSRRIKCDEQLPECKNCIRARLNCAYLALDEAARDALREAQKAHLLRIEALDQQQQEQEEKLALQYQQQHQQQMAQHEMELQNHQERFSAGQQPHFHHNEVNSYISKSFRYPLSNLPLPTSQPLEINLQRDNFPPIHQNLPPPQFPPQTINSITRESHTPSNASSTINSITRESHTPSNAGSVESSTRHTSSTTASSVSVTPDNTTTAPPTQKEEPSYAVESGAYDSLSALIKHHQDYIPLNDFSKIDGEYIEIVLDPECLKYLNTYWTAIQPGKLERFKNGFEKEDLYQEYETCQRLTFREASSNFVLFKALLSVGQVILNEKSQDEEVRTNSGKFLSRDLELSLRFLNKFRISFNIFNVEAQSRDNFQSFDTKKFHENISLVFAKFQIFQTAITTTHHGPYNLKDHIEISDRFFQFIESYLGNQFEIFNCQPIVAQYGGDAYFQRAKVLSEYMYVLIMYYIQCTKSYHTKPYNFEMLREIYNELRGNVRTLVFGKLSSGEQSDFNNLELYLKFVLEYLDGVHRDNKPSNKNQMLFYIIKRFTEVLPEHFSFASSERSFESQLLMAYFNAVASSLREIFPETRFFFLYSFSGKQGALAEQSVIRFYDILSSKNKSSMSEQEVAELETQKEQLRYPIKVFSFLKNRLSLYSQYLADITNFPAKIILDNTNRTIVFNLVQEQQLTSFKNVDIPQAAYPNIDKNSNFLNKATNTIQIPSVPMISAYSNFADVYSKRKLILNKAVELPFTEWDHFLLKRLYPKVVEQ